MKKITTFLKLSLLAFTIVFSINNATSQQALGSDNLAVLVAGASANNTTVSVVEINKADANQTAIQTISVPGTGDDAIRVSGSATSTLYAANSDDGSLFCFTGHKSDATGVNANTLTTRAVLALDINGVLSVKTTYTGTSGNQTRCATSLNNTDFYIADQGGQFTNAATAASPAGNFRASKAFGGVVYVGQASATLTTIQVSTSAAITGGTITGLPGLTNHANLQDFYLIKSGVNGAAYDVLYVLRATSNTVGAIDKYSLVEGTWVANGTYVTDFGGFGLAAEKATTGVNLYLTTGLGALTANKVKKLYDAAGYNAELSITTGAIVDLYTAATGTILKGLAFAPKDLGSSVSATKKTLFYVANNTLIFADMPSSTVEVYSLSGSKVASFDPAVQINLNLAKGVYIIRLNNEASKIMIF
jgi:hypothetical protein